MAEKDVAGADAIETIKSLTDGIHIAMLTTVAEDGTLHSRPMATEASEFDGTLWFLARQESGKIEEIREDSHVLVSYAEPKDGKYLSLQGVAGIVRDRAQIHEHWTPQAKAWFPQGEDDPAIALIRVKVTGGEYWSASSSTLVRMGKLAVAAVTGADKVNVGDSGKIRL